VRLTSAVLRLEGRRRHAVRTAGVIWSADELLLGRELAAGEFLAVDLCAVPPDPDPSSEHQSDVPVVTQSRERGTVDPLDLGDVYDGDGVLVGRVYDVIPGPVPLVYWCGLADVDRLKSGLAAGRGLMSHGSGRR